MADIRAPPSDLVRFLDSHGLPWVVSEVRCADVPGARAERCLVFESQYVVRRVWTYPRYWRELDPGELERLSWAR
jgi:hypothetical protein